MKKKALFLVVAFLFTLIVVLAYFKYNSFAQSEQSKTSDVENVIIQKLDSIIQTQSTILKRLDDVETQVKSRCR